MPPPNVERGPQGRGPVQTTHGSERIAHQGTAALDEQRVRLRALNRRGDSYVGETAERTMAGVAVISQEGAAWARDRLTAADFHDQRCWRVVVAGAKATGIYGEKRIRYLAGVTDTEPAWLRDIEEHTPVMFDWNGAYALEVRVAAADRRRAVELAIELEQITGKSVIVTDHKPMEIVPEASSDQLTLEGVA
jgi:hypothetical protein